jgi:hypothetical protein
MDVEQDSSSTSVATLESTKRPRKKKWPKLNGRKTEDLNKFWIRKFRSYVRKNRHLLIGVRDFSWWDDFMNRSKEPGVRGAPFFSYNKKFKNHLKANEEYLARIQRWYIDFGKDYAFKKHGRDVEFAKAVCEYAEEELMDFWKQRFWESFQFEDWCDQVFT